MKTIRAMMASVTLAACVWGCDGAPDVVDEVVSGLESTGLPNGATCGLAYRRPGSPVIGTGCEGVQTIEPSSAICLGWNQPTVRPPGFVLASDGDRGLPACYGFWHWRFNETSGADSTNFRLPKGTACGFKEACNNSGERCMGFDANVSCPAGWVKKLSSDLNAPNGCGFVWCEYQDPNNLCTSRACQYDNQPMGLVCGITDNDRNNGQCQGMLTKNGCPWGYSRYGFFDDGRSAGHGVGWCAKNFVIP